jgi:hypothetical protein
MRVEKMGGYTRCNLAFLDDYIKGAGYGAGGAYVFALGAPCFARSAFIFVDESYYLANQY